jgi:hypothetical protein
LNGRLEEAVRLFVVTVIGRYVAPIGTATVMDVLIAAETTALTAPK